jgi:hypothetical protein
VFNEEKSESVSTGERDKETKVRKGYKKTEKRLNDEEFPVEYKRVLSITLKNLGHYLQKIQYLHYHDLSVPFREIIVICGGSHRGSPTH